MNNVFEDNRTLVRQYNTIADANNQWKEKVTNAENARDKAMQHSYAVDARINGMRQELDAAKAVARDAEGVLATDARVKELELAICKHRDASGHDRCWENDLELYRLVGGTIEPTMPPLPEFMHNCAAYYEGQCRRVETPTAAESKDAAVS